ncbi:MAG TPA: DNA polymerase III subunit beta, partial [bacterium]|nr:DNA polymerase III subunit beta [bacterium]
LYVSGTDMDISITTSIECNVEEEGDVTVNAKQLLGIIRELPSGEINIKVENERVTIDFKNGQSSIMGMPSVDYPALKDSIEGNEIKISGTNFVEMVEKTSFSVSQDRTRLALTGIYWKVSSDEMIMVSTDGHRLSLFSKKMEMNIEKSTEAIIPSKSLNQAAQIISGGADIERIVFGEGAILFDFGTTTIFSKLIEGPYPDFRQVIPNENSKHVFVSSEEFSASVRRVSVLSNSITHQIRMAISSGLMEVNTKNDDIGGESRESIAVRYDGEPIIAGYNAAFLSEILRKIETDEVLLELESPTTACILKPVGQKETDEFVYLIMPLRISD